MGENAPFCAKGGVLSAEEMISGKPPAISGEPEIVSDETEIVSAKPEMAPGGRPAARGEPEMVFRGPPSISCEPKTVHRRRSAAFPERRSANGEVPPPDPRRNPLQARSAATIATRLQGRKKAVPRDGEAFLD